MSKETTTNKWEKPTQEKINGWKKEHEGVFKLKVSDPAQPQSSFEAYMRKPKIEDIQRAIASERKKAFTSSRSIWENCKLAWDPEFERNETILLGLYTKIDEVIEIPDATVEKL